LNGGTVAAILSFMASSRLAPTDDTYASPPLDIEILFYKDKWTKLDADIGML